VLFRSASTPPECIDILNEHAVAGTRHRAAQPHENELSDATTTVGHLRELIYRFVDERDWHPFHDPKNLSASIAIEAAELMELFQWLRSDQLDGVRRDGERMSKVREEIADVLAYVLSFAEAMNIDLSSALTDKVKRNAVKYPVERFKGRFE